MSVGLAYVRQVALVAGARSQLGVRFQHQGRRPSEFLDCIGLVVHAARMAGLEVIDRTDYDAMPDGHTLTAELMAQLDPVPLDQLELADIVGFHRHRRFGPQHVGIISALEPLRMIHTYAELGRVAEHGIDERWLRMASGAWRWRWPS